MTTTPTAPQDVLTSALADPLERVKAARKWEQQHGSLSMAALLSDVATVLSTPPVTQAASAEGESVGMEEVRPGKFCEQLTDVPKNIVVTCDNPAACDEYGCQRKELEARKEDCPDASLLNLFMYANSLSWDKTTQPISNEIHRFLRESRALLRTAGGGSK